MRIAHFTNWAIPESTLPSSERTNFRTIQYPKAAPAKIIPTNRKTETCDQEKAKLVRFNNSLNEMKNNKQHEQQEP